MMLHYTCQQVLDYLSDYLDRSLPAEELAHLDEHLAVCPECVDYLNNLRMTLSAARAAYTERGTIEPIPEPVVAAILAARQSAPPNVGRGESETN